MGYTFSTAPTILNGSIITAIEHVSMSNAFNDRLMSGLGDGTRRIHQYILGLFRQVRNPDETGMLWPPLAEWSEYYSYVEPTDAYWPGIDAGDPEGANINSNPAMRFIFGDSSLDNEGDRLTAPILFPEGNTPYDQWQIAKYQRGGYDPSTNGINAPMLEVALSHSFIQNPGWSFHKKSYGGYMPIPRVLGTCFDGLYTSLNLEYKFTNIDTGEVVTYNGSCGPDAGGTSTDVQGVYEYEFAYYVYQFDGALTIFNKTDWIEGPYTGGGYLARRNGDQINRLMLQPFLKDFRGTSEQRSGSCYDLFAVAADYQYFFTSQYQLSPNYATTAEGILDIHYPYFTFSGDIGAGTQTSICSTHEGFKLGGYYIQYLGADADTTLELWENDTLTISTPLNASQSQYVVTHPSGSSTFYWRIKDAVNSTGSLYIEYSELLQYKPKHYDAYAYMRLSSAAVVSGDEFLDTNGKDTEASATIINNYKHYGAVVNLGRGSGVDGQLAVVNTNPVYESARQTILDWTRVVSRSELAGYEVINDSGKQKSVLHFRRYNKGQSGTMALDTFDGIHQGIHRLAPTASFSNEWVMDISLKMYGGTINDPNDTSEWKTAVYGDYFPFIQRCHLLNPRISSINNYDMFMHFQQTPSQGYIDSAYADRLFAPEALSAYNYAQNSNHHVVDHTKQENFYRSCQIYPEPYYIESASLYTSGAIEYVRLQFSKRFQSCSVAPATISKDHTTWNYTDIQNEDYRTDENGIREYILANNGYGETSTKTGDTAVYASPGSETGNMHGSVIPHFFFTKLIPKPFCDTANPVEHTGSIDPTRTIVDINRFNQMEMYLRAMCEGYVDGVRAATCYDGALELSSNAYDYTWENLNYDGHGGRWMPILPLTVRDDEPQGYGPLPNTVIYANWHNQLANMVNLLKLVRVPLPYQLQCNQISYVGSSDYTPDWGITDCPSSTNKAIKFNATLPSATTFVGESGWADCDTLSSTVGSLWDLSCNGTAYHVETNRSVTYFKFTPLDPSAYLAMSANLYSLYTGTSNGLFCRMTTTTNRTKAVQVESPYEATACKLPDDPDNNFWWDSDTGTGYAIRGYPDDGTTSVCIVIKDGVLDAGAAPPNSDLAFGRNGSSRPCPTGASLAIGVTPVSNLENIVQVPLV